jgi:hypothetical protein
MEYILIPHETTSTETLLWIGAFKDPENRKIELLYRGGAAHAIDDWHRWPESGPDAKLYYHRLTLSGLKPGSTYFMRLSVDGTDKATCTVKTLPAELPGLDGPPLKVLLGSCFCVAKDKEARVGKTFFHLPEGARPDIKILSGDQVYLDSPWYYYLLHTHSRSGLERKLFDHYLRTWTQSPLGFHYLLKTGANFFSSDDHELWNNAPNFAPYVRDSWTGEGRERWTRVAESLYRVFQTPSTATRFDVHPLSFLVADTRLNRDAQEKNFMTSADLNAVADWIENLVGPGVLVLGQPVFRKKTGLLGHVSDWSLPDFDQYRDLVRILMGSRQPLVLLTGDVHFGRAAWATLPSGAELVEIISSPLALVSRAAEGDWEPAPSRFPAEPIGGIPFCTVETLPRGVFSPTYGHFITVEFSRIARGVRIAARSWRADGTPDLSDPFFVKTLKHGRL